MSAAHNSIFQTSAPPEFAAAIDVPACDYGRDWMIGPATRLIDTWAPWFEEILLPPARFDGGPLRVEYYARAETLPPADGRRRRLATRLRPSWARNSAERLDLGRRPFTDLRQNSPSNWAHAITNHLPEALLARAACQHLGLADPLVVLPADVAGYTQRFFEAVGFEPVCTDAVVDGALVRTSWEPRMAIRNVRARILAEWLPGTPLGTALRQSQKATPPRIYASRKDSRCLTNDTEIEQALAEQGFEKRYMEDHPVEDQFRLLLQAEEIVGLHGAGLAPLLARAIVPTRPWRLVEIFSPGHVTTVYRVATRQLGGAWVGVRGNLWPELVRDLHRAVDPHKHAFRSYTADPQAVLHALEKARRPEVQRPLASESANATTNGNVQLDGDTTQSFTARLLAGRELAVAAAHEG